MRGQHPAAIEDFSTAISLAPSAAEPYNGRGISYLALGDDENAKADITTAVGLDRSSAESWANLGLIQERSGERSKAAKSYARAVQLDPKYTPASEGLARIRGS